MIAAAVLGTVSVCADDSPSTSASSSVLMEADTGKILFSENEDEISLIASTTKIMTAIVVLENCDADEVVTVGEECTGIEGSSIYLKPDERITVRELLYGLMLESGNDAAEALAVFTCGSIERFSGLMNNKAEELGLTSTHYTNPHGLDSTEHYSTARDLAVLMRYALKNPNFIEICGTKSITFGERTFINHNKLLWSDTGVFAGKTGYTDEAGRILVTSCKRNEMTLICVTINDRNDWSDHSALYNWGYESYSYKMYAATDGYACSLPVISSEFDSIPVLYSNNLTALIRSGDVAEVKLELPRFIYAPVKSGEAVGTAILIVNGEETERIELISGADCELADIKEKNLWIRLMEYIIDFTGITDDT